MSWWEKLKLLMAVAIFGVFRCGGRMDTVRRTAEDRIHVTLIEHTDKNCQVLLIDDHQQGGVAWWTKGLSKRSRAPPHQPQA
jgi:hypothetical protein